MFPTLGGDIARIRIDEMRESSARHAIAASLDHQPFWRLRLARGLVGAGARLVGLCADELFNALERVEPDAALR
jgi:hypothetical protein